MQGRWWHDEVWHLTGVQVSASGDMFGQIVKWHCDHTNHRQDITLHCQIHNPKNFQHSESPDICTKNVANILERPSFKHTWLAKGVRQLETVVHFLDILPRETSVHPYCTICDQREERDHHSWLRCTALPSASGRQEVEWVIDTVSIPTILVNEWINIWINGWMNQYMNKWLNE